MTTQKYEVMGWVVAISSQPRDDPIVFTLRTNKDVEYRCECSFFGAQLHPGDSMYGQVHMLGERHLRFVGQPFVQVPVGEENVKTCFVRALHGSGFGQVSAQNLYDRLAELAQLANYARKRLEERKKAAEPGSANISAPTIAGVPQPKVKDEAKIAELTTGPDGVIAYLSDAAARFNKTSDAQIVENLVKGTKLKSSQVEALLRWWHQHRSLRRLHLFGLTNAEIKGCYKPLDEIYEICMLNPYRLPSIPIEKAERIMLSMQKTPSGEEILCGQVVRKVYEMQERMGYTCTPLWMLAKQFSNFHVMKATLEKDYELVIEHKSAYLPYAHRVEKYVAEYVDAKIKEAADRVAKHLKRISEPPSTDNAFPNYGPLPLPGGVQLPQAQAPAVLDVEAKIQAAASDEKIGLPAPEGKAPEVQVDGLGLVPSEKGDKANVEVSPVGLEGKARAMQDGTPALEEKEAGLERKAPKDDEISLPPQLRLPLADTPDLESCMYRCKTLTPPQKLSIQWALELPICIIRGGAGTGKSTIIGEIVNNLQIREEPFLAAGFTGRSVSRLEEILKCKLASTLDRAIARASTMPPFRHLLLDESSMNSTELIYRFIRAFPGKYNITIVGDENQLQPIGWGTFMKQLLASKRVPTFTLKVNHRLQNYTMTAETPPLPDHQSPGEAKFDRIVLENANALIDPKRDLGTPLIFREGTSFNMIDGGIEYVQTIVRGLRDAGVDKNRITVITPYNEYLDPLNLIFQNIYLEGAKKVVDTQKRLWCVGSRVMMLVNNYDINVMNGEDGEVTDLTDEGVIVKFGDGAEHTFKWQSSKPSWKRGGDAWRRKKQEEGEIDADGQELTIEQIRLSFAKSIHKCQGSECDFCIIYFPMRYNRNGSISTSSFLNINMLYTALTRTKLACWIVGSLLAVEQATCRKPPHRYENLCLRLLQLQDKEKEKVLLPYTAEGESVKEEAPPEEDMPQHEDESMYENPSW